MRKTSRWSRVGGVLILTHYQETVNPTDNKLYKYNNCLFQKNFLFQKIVYFYVIEIESAVKDLMGKR